MLILAFLFLGLIALGYGLILLTRFVVADGLTQLLVEADQIHNDSKR